VAEQHRGGTEPAGGFVQGEVAGRPGGSLGPAAAADGRRGHLDRRQPEVEEPGGHLGGPVRRARLQAVVDGDGAGTQSGPRRLVRQRDRQGHRVGAAAAGHQDQVARRQVGHRGADRPAYGSDLRRRPHAPSRYRWPRCR
jgi:hypothetical protein